jgi:cell division septum initiation protein DivIVA
MSTSQRRDLANRQKQLRADTAERLEAIVEAAERAAEKVIDDAEGQARRYLAQAKAEADRVSESRLGELSDLIDTLLGQAAALRLEAERLQATLETAQAQIDSEESSSARRPQPVEEPREVQPPRLRAVTHGEQPDFAPEAPHSDAAGARLLATQMAVSGSSREEIETRLRKGFEIEDTKAILDAILGPEG